MRILELNSLLFFVAVALICQAQHGNLKKSGGARGVLDVVAMHLSCDYAVCVGALGRGSIAVDWDAVKDGI